MESYTTSDWLNQLVKPNTSCVNFKLLKIRRFNLRMLFRMASKYRSRSLYAFMVIFVFSRKARVYKHFIMVYKNSTRRQKFGAVEIDSVDDDILNASS